jgi:hypothetical protein
MVLPSSNWPTAERRAPAKLSRRLLCSAAVSSEKRPFRIEPSFSEHLARADEAIDVSDYSWREKRKEPQLSFNPNFLKFGANMPKTLPEWIALIIASAISVPIVMALILIIGPIIEQRVVLPFDHFFFPSHR